MAKVEITPVVEEQQIKKSLKSKGTFEKNYSHRKKDKTRKMLFIFELQDFDGYVCQENETILHLGMASKPY